MRLLSGFGRHLVTALRVARDFAGRAATGGRVLSPDELRSDKHCSPALRLGPLDLPAVPTGMPVETVEHVDAVDAVSLSSQTTRRFLLVLAAATFSPEERLLLALLTVELVEASHFATVAVDELFLRRRLPPGLITASVVANVTLAVRFRPGCELVEPAAADDVTGRGRKRLWL